MNQAFFTILHSLRLHLSFQILFIIQFQAFDSYSQSVFHFHCQLSVQFRKVQLHNEWMVSMVLLAYFTVVDARASLGTAFCDLKHTRF